jgi:hypothetical protein
MWAADLGWRHTHPPTDAYIHMQICLPVFRCLFLSLLVCLSVCLSMSTGRCAKQSAHATLQDMPTMFPTLTPSHSHTDAEEREAALSEAVRLAVLHARLTAPSAAAVIAAVKVDTSDVGGRTLALLRAWRQRRIAAVEREVARLAAVHGMPATELAVLVDRTLAAGQLAGNSVGGGASVADVGVVLDGSSDTTTTSAIESEDQDIWTALTDWLHSLGGEVRHVACHTDD